MENKILGLRTTIYRVGDIDKAKKWYAEAFETEPYFDQPFYVGFDIGGYELGLQPEANPVQHKPDNVVAYWGVNDIASSLSRFTILGAVLSEEAKDVGEGVIVAVIKDPWGNSIGLIYNPYFKVQ